MERKIKMEDEQKIKKEIKKEKKEPKEEIKKEIKKEKKEPKEEIKKEIKKEKKEPKEEIKKEIKKEKKETKEEKKEVKEEEEDEIEIIKELPPKKDVDKSWMRMALEYAEEALAKGEVPVGCLFIYNNEAIANGINTVNETKNATRHAEMNCIDMVLKWASANSIPPKEIFKEIKVVVTVEPCVMCTAALLELEIPQIIYGCANNRFGGCGSATDIQNIYKNSKTVIQGGIYADKAIHLLKTFYKGENPNAPKSKAKKK